MKKTLVGMRLWEIIYPIGIYFVISNLAVAVLQIIWTKPDDNSFLIWQLIANVVALPFICSFYQKGDRKSWKGRRVQGVVAAMGMAVFVAMAGIAANNLIGLTPLVEHSATFRKVNEDFYGGTLAMELAVLAVVTPALEELLYRGIVYRRLRDWVGVRRGIAISAFLFGIMHFNMVQFLYAFVIGLLLAVAMERGGLPCAILAHGLTNLLSILRTEIPALHYLQSSARLYATETLVAALVGLLAWLFATKMVKKKYFLDPK